MFQKNVVLPRFCTKTSSPGVLAPYGKRKNGTSATGRPSASETLASPDSISVSACFSGSLPRSAWLKVCEPTMCPAATTWRAISGCAAALRPISKKSARTPAPRRISSTRAVRVACGPSSKVIAICPSASWPSV